MYYKTILSLAIIMFLTSCGRHSNSEQLELDNGNKWLIIESMAVYIQTMEEDVSTFESSAEKDYQKLAEKLQHNIGLLTANCTMKGKAHDELHKWLVPNIELVKALTKAKNENESKEIFRKIQDSFQTYNQYFH